MASDDGALHDAVAEFVEKARPGDSIPWYYSPGLVHTFAGVLVRADRLDIPQLVIDYFEKPHKWDPEHEIWQGCGRPDLDDENWDLFLRKLDQESR